MYREQLDQTSTYDESDIESIVLQKLQNVMIETNDIANGKLQDELDQSRTELHEYVQTDCIDHPEHRENDDYIPYSPEGKAIFKKFLIAVRKYEVSAAHIEFGNEQTDIEIRELVGDRTVRITPLEGVDLADITEQADGETIVGNLSHAVPLLGALVVRTVNGEHIEARMFRDSETGEIQQQAELKIIDQ